MSSSSSPVDRYKVLVYNNRPVADQKEVVGGKVAIKFHDGGKLTVLEQDWVAKKRSVFVPRKLGPRCVVVKNWSKYSSLCEQ